ncbi:MAG TPA: TIM barrel protein, partial [Candidatus Limnocylindria bacterium]|nr:TIM barrel protein [Candidatus Limnocylindria bacterium]
YLNHPEKIAYCIDTAHAYAYGYNLVDVTEREACIALLDTTLGIENIVLIHLNDTYEKLGSKLDKHQTLGQGSLGETALRAFSFHERLHAIPLLMELPVVSQEEEERNLALVRGWHT